MLLYILYRMFWKSLLVMYWYHYILHSARFSINWHIYSVYITLYTQDGVGFPVVLALWGKTTETRLQARHGMKSHAVYQRINQRA